MKIKSNKIKFNSPIMWVLGGLLVFYVVFLLMLIVWGFFVTLKADLAINAVNPENVFRTNIFGLPKGMPWEWEWRNYAQVLEHIYADVDVKINGNFKRVRVELMGMLKNTLFYTFGGAAVSTFLPLFVAYATSKTDYKFSAIFDAVILIVMVIPIVGAYPSELQVLNTLRLYDTWAGYYIQRAHCISAYYLIFTAVFRSIPYTYSEAAYIEGAGEYTVMLRVIMPLARTVAMTVFLIFFITIWNDYNTSLLYMPSHPALAYGIFYVLFKGNNALSQDVPMKFAGSFLLFSPILVLFVLFRKVLMQNLSMGGLKE